MNDKQTYSPQFGYPQTAPYQQQGRVQASPAVDSSREEDGLFDFSHIANQTRIAVYDDPFATPRIEEIQPDETKAYIGAIAARTYHLAKEEGGQIPYMVILELVENFIHAYFKEPVISILDGGNTIRFSDQGPGIEKKSLAQQPGFSSATAEMKSYIRGVGSGLPVVKSYLEVQSGKLLMEDNLKQGTVITISINPSSKIQRPSASPHKQVPVVILTEREQSILLYIERDGSARLTDIATALDLPNSSVHKTVNRLVEENLLEKDPSKTGKHYTLSDEGSKTLNLLHQQEV